MYNFYFQPASFFDYYSISERHPFWVTHTKAWVNVIEKTFPQIKAYVISDCKKIDTTTSFLPIYRIKRPFKNASWLSIPYATVCDPILENGTIKETLINSLLRDSRMLNSKIELRFNSKYHLPGFNISHNFVNHQLHLDGNEQEIFSRFHKKSVQVIIQKSLKAGTVLKTGKTLDDVAVFYRLYIRTRRELGLPPQPYSFFKNMWTELYPNNNVDLLFAENNGKIIAALWILKNKWLHTFEYVARAEHRDKFHSAHFLYWNGIIRAMKANASVVSLARTSAHNTGLNKFKLNWGTVAKPYYDYTYPVPEKQTREDCFSYKLLKNNLQNFL